MASPSELSLEEIRLFMVNNNGKVTNHDLVNYFKKFLTNPETKGDARMKFKDYVNKLASMKNENGEKFLYLKSRYQTSIPSEIGSSCSSLDTSWASPNRQPPPYRPPPAVSPAAGDSLPHSIKMPENLNLNAISERVEQSEMAPAVPPRKKSIDKYRQNKENFPENSSKKLMDYNVELRKKSIDDDLRKDSVEAKLLRQKSREMLEQQSAWQQPTDKPMLSRKNSDELLDNDVMCVDQMENEASEVEKISVKERMRKFNRMASETELLKSVPASSGKTKSERGFGSGDDDDRSSVTSLVNDPKCRDWLIKAAQCDYQEMAKLAIENPRLVRVKDPATGYTALHWAAKHGDENVIKLIAGTYAANVNAKTNGGYTPLHIAMQFDREEIYNLLSQVYGADANLRDYSGRKPRQYQHTTDTSVSADTFRKIKARKKHSDKDLGFLRIGSLNVRVKKTTEAFSHFLGVGPSRGNAANNINNDKRDPYNSKQMKSWGSADNIPQVERIIMPPPKLNQIKKRRSRRPQDFSTLPPSGTIPHSHSMPSTPNQVRAEGGRSGSIGSTESGSTIGAPDSDSDTACGFDSNWAGSKTKLKSANYI